MWIRQRYPRRQLLKTTRACWVFHENTELLLEPNSEQWGGKESVENRGLRSWEWILIQLKEDFCDSSQQAQTLVILQIKEQAMEGTSRAKSPT